jgi:hypothetical protein
MVDFISQIPTDIWRCILLEWVNACSDLGRFDASLCNTALRVIYSHWLANQVWPYQLNHTPSDEFIRWIQNRQLIVETVHMVLDNGQISKASRDYLFSKYLSQKTKNIFIDMTNKNPAVKRNTNTVKRFLVQCFNSLEKISIFKFKIDENFVEYEFDIILILLATSSFCSKFKSFTTDLLIHPVLPIKLFQCQTLQYLELLQCKYSDRQVVEMLQGLPALSTLILHQTRSATISDFGNSHRSWSTTITEQRFPALTSLTLRRKLVRQYFELSGDAFLQIIGCSELLGIIAAHSPNLQYCSFSHGHDNMLNINALTHFCPILKDVTIHLDLSSFEELHELSTVVNMNNDIFHPFVENCPNITKLHFTVKQNWRFYVKIIYFHIPSQALIGQYSNMITSLNLEFIELNLTQFLKLLKLQNLKELILSSVCFFINGFSDTAEFSVLKFLHAIIEEEPIIVSRTLRKIHITCAWNQSPPDYRKVIAAEMSFLITLCPCLQDIKLSVPSMSMDRLHQLLHFYGCNLKSFTVIVFEHSIFDWKELSDVLCNCNLLDYLRVENFSNENLESIKTFLLHPNLSSLRYVDIGSIGNNPDFHEICLKLKEELREQNRRINFRFSWWLGGSE